MLRMAHAVTAMMLAAAAKATEARVVTIRLYDDKSKCLVTNDVMDKSKLKVADCDDPYQRRTKLWEIGDAGDREKIEYEYWRPYDDDSLCVEAPKVKSGKSLQLRKCKRSNSAKTRQIWGFRCCGHQIVPILSMNPTKCAGAECSNLFVWMDREPGRSPKSGDRIKLKEWSREWDVVEEDAEVIDAFSSTSWDGEDKNDNACRMFQLEDYDYCIEPKFGNIGLKQRLALTKCSQYDEEQHWCFDEKDRIHAYEAGNLCWKASCMDEGCSVKLKRCSNSDKQRWIHLEQRELWKKGSKISEPICLKKDKRLCIAPVAEPDRDVELELQLRDIQWLQLAGEYT